MPTLPKVTKLTISGLFWKDLATWRHHPDYPFLRANIARMVMLAAQGEPAGDMPFRGRRKLWEGVGHAHVGLKLTLFTTRPQTDEIRLCCLRKHDFYGYGSERSNIAPKAATIVHNASRAPHANKPGWTSLRWKDPGDIAEHPELPELSREALCRLREDIEHEENTLERYEDLVSRGELSRKMSHHILDLWAEGISAAYEAIDVEILRDARRPKPFNDPRSVEVWLAPEL